MPTITVKTIGTGGDYSTLQAWEDACPTNLVTADEVWKGEVKNQEFVNTTTLLTIAGQTTDATRYVWLTTEAGASFADNANKRTNALRYNASNGAAIRSTAGYTSTLTINTNHTLITKLQFKSDGTTTWCVQTSGSVTFEQVIIQAVNRPAYTTATTIARNCLSIADTNTSVPAWFHTGASIAMYNCTLAKPSNRTVNNSALHFQYSTATLKNCAGFGFTNFTNSSSATGSHNASDVAITFGTSNQASLTYADQFEQTSSASGTHDFRVKSGSALIDTGTSTSGDGVATDIVGSSRSGTYDISAWETVIAAITGTGAFTFGGITVAGAATYTAPSTSGVPHGVLRRRGKARQWANVPEPLKPVVAQAENYADVDAVAEAVERALANYARMSARASIARRERMIDDMKRLVIAAVERAAEIDDEEALLVVL